MSDILSSQRNRAMIIEALMCAAEELEGYVRWINDRPMRPAREVAVEKLRQEALEHRKLALAVMDSARARAPTTDPSKEG